LRRGEDFTYFATNSNPENIARAIEQFKPKTIIHVAAVGGGKRSSETILDQIEANITFPSLVLNAAYETGCRQFINTGSSWQEILGDGYRPFDFYSATKQSFENILDDYAMEGMKCITFRLFDVYGDNDPRPKLMNLFNRIAQSGETLDMSPGDQKVDLVHVDWVCSNYLAGLNRLSDMQSEGHEIYTVSGGNPRSLKEIAASESARLGKPLNINWGGRPYRPREIMEPKSRYRSLLSL